MTPEEKQARVAQIAERASTATKGPWQVRYMETMHRLDSPICKETCGKGNLPIRLEHSSQKEAARYRGITEMHVNQDLDLVVDIIADDGSHVFCTGHDYDEAGLVAPNDAEFIAHARADIDLLLSLVKEQEAALAEANKRLDDALVRAAEDQDYDSEQRTKLTTAMRSACVEKVKTIAQEYQLKVNDTRAGTFKDEYAAMRNAANEIAKSLESLSIEKDSTTGAL